MTTTNRVSATRRVEAPAATVFSLLSDPSRHPDFDGSGMLVASASPGLVTDVGSVFTMRMRNDELGDYRIDNHVVEFDRDRRIAWEPVLSAVSGDEHREDIGRNRHVRWGYELDSAGPDVTLVTEFFDCSRAPEDFQRILKGGKVWEGVIDASLDKLEQLAKEQTVTT